MRLPVEEGCRYLQCRGVFKLTALLHPAVPPLERLGRANQSSGLGKGASCGVTTLCCALQQTRTFRTQDGTAACFTPHPILSACRSLLLAQSGFAAEERQLMSPGSRYAFSIRRPPDHGRDNCRPRVTTQVATGYSTTVDAGRCYCRQGALPDSTETPPSEALPIRDPSRHASNLRLPAPPIPMPREPVSPGHAS